MLIVMYLPDWIQGYKAPRTEIKRIKNGFYKYEVAFVYSKEKERTEKKTIRLLGKITEKDGFIPSPKDTLRRKSEELPQVDIKTFGLYYLFSELMGEEIASLKRLFGDGQAELLFDALGLSNAGKAGRQLSFARFLFRTLGEGGHIG
jgi:hypothetical protein